MKCRFGWQWLHTVVAACSIGLTAGGAVRGLQHKAFPGGQKAVALFRRRAEQYERDAEDAEKAAEHYAKLAQDAVHTSEAQVPARVMAKLKEAHVNEWARAALHMERLMDDPRPKAAVEAGLKARAIYDKRWNQYVAAEATYGEAARGYNLRANMDSEQASQLRAYGDQLKLEGDAGSAATYSKQAQLLDDQADKLKKVARNYGTMEGKIRNAADQIESMASKAEKFAQWQANPSGTPGDGDLPTYTIAPPLSVTVAPVLAPGMMTAPGMPR
eukprot:TRINITY_DN15023_c0_g1_i1.p2 TRINITY_DN15023_c0_g1~~TRINITY_DN15023_c0_g1_i1.p2  ORF type:complete len:272 (-),score=81.44 TRINITY_DN15023_c0_g1_i1:106-921(-)